MKASKFVKMILVAAVSISATIACGPKDRERTAVTFTGNKKATPNQQKAAAELETEVLKKREVRNADPVSKAESAKLRARITSIALEEIRNGTQVVTLKMLDEKGQPLETKKIPFAVNSDKAAIEDQDVVIKLSKIDGNVVKVVAVQLKNKTTETEFTHLPSSAAIVFDILEKKSTPGENALLAETGDVEKLLLSEDKSAPVLSILTGEDGMAFAHILIKNKEKSTNILDLTVPLKDPRKELVVTAGEIGKSKIEYALSRLVGEKNTIDLTVSLTFGAGDKTAAHQIMDLTIKPDAKGSVTKKNAQTVEEKDAAKVAAERAAAEKTQQEKDQVAANVAAGQASSEQAAKAALERAEIEKAAEAEQKEAELKEAALKEQAAQAQRAEEINKAAEKAKLEAAAARIAAQMKSNPAIKGGTPK